MKKYALIFATLFAIVLALGCTGQEETTQEGVGDGYTLKVSPEEVVVGGMVTLDLRLTNSFERTMNNVKVTMPEIGASTYTKSGEIASDGTSILPGQTIPFLLTISIPDSAFGELTNKNVKVCFDYTTDYYFDTTMKSRISTEEFSTTQGQTSGPITISTTGLDLLYIEANKTTGSLEVKNSWQGYIENVTSIKATVPTELSYMELKVGSNCSDNAAVTGSGDSKVSGTLNVTRKDTNGCDKIFGNAGVIASGLTLVSTINETDDVAGVARTTGLINYQYCYKIPVPTIKIKTVPQ